MKKFKLKNVTFAVLLALPALATAQQQVKPIELDAIEVAATGHNPDKVNAAKIEIQQAGLIKDIVRKIPGADVGGTNSINQRIYMRGVNEQGLNIKIDGARQKGNLFHHVGNLLIDPEMIKRADVKVGTNSVSDGSGSLGGSVNFTTIDATDLLEQGKTFGAKVKTGFSSNNKEWQKSFALYGTVADQFDLLGYYNHKSYKKGKSGDKTSIGGVGADGDLLLKASWNIDQFNKLSLSSETQSIGGDELPRKAEFVGKDYHKEKYVRNTQTLAYSYTPDNPWINLQTNIYRSKNDYDWDKDGKGYMKINTVTDGAMLKNSSSFQTGDTVHGVNVGFEIFNNKVTDTIEDNVHIDVPSEKTSDYSLYVEDAIVFGGFTVTPGLRYDHSTLTYQTGETNTNSKLSKALDVRYDFESGLGLYASYTDIFRAPDTVEVIRLANAAAKKGLTNKTESLKAQNGSNKEFGFSYNHDTLLVVDDYFSFSAKYFKTDYKNLLAFDTAPGESWFARYNTGKAKTTGFELTTSYQFENMNFALGYSHAKFKQIDKRYNDENKLLVGEAVGRDLGDKLTLGFGYDIPASDISLNWDSIFISKSASGLYEEQHYPKGPSAMVNAKKPAYNVHDFSVNWHPKADNLKNIQVTFGVYNIFNKNYASHTSRDVQGLNYDADLEPGRTIKASISYKF